MAHSIHTQGAAKELSTNAYARNGYIFCGWSKTSNGLPAYRDKEEVTDVSTTNGDMVILYAAWEPIPPRRSPLRNWIKAML